MTPDTPSRLFAARAALVAAPVLSALSVVLQPALDGGPSRQLSVMGTTSAAISAAAFLVAQLPMLVAILAIGRLLLPGARKLSAWGTGLGVLGCFGHIAFGGLSLSMVMMSRDDAHRDVYARLLGRIVDSPIMLVSIAGLLGTVVGLLLLGIGLFRTRTGPIWVGPAIWTFLVVEFVGSSLSAYASYLSVLLLAVAFWALVPSLIRDRAVARPEVEDRALTQA